MPLVSVSDKKDIVKQYELLQNLEEKCKKSILVGKKKDADNTFIYSVENPIRPKYDTMLAVCQYGEKYAVLAPEDLTEKESIVFAYFLDNVEPGDYIIVFSRRDYDAAKKYLGDKNNKVLLSC